MCEVAFDQRRQHHIADADRRADERRSDEEGHRARQPPQRHRPDQQDQRTEDGALDAEPGGQARRDGSGQTEEQHGQGGEQTRCGAGELLVGGDLVEPARERVGIGVRAFGDADERATNELATEATRLIFALRCAASLAKPHSLDLTATHA